MANLQNMIDSSTNNDNTMSAYNNVYYDDTITPDQWTLYDKILYGGFGYSSFCMPDNVLTIALSIIFPPLGLISALVSKHIDKEMPWLNIDTLTIIYKYFDKIIYCFILTSLFYIPGLIYVMQYINNPNPDNTDDEIETFLSKI